MSAARVVLRSKIGRFFRRFTPAVFRPSSRYWPTTRGCGLCTPWYAAGELCVTDLALSLGMKPQAVSNQLQRLSDLGILARAREGNNIYYRIVNSCVAPLLDLALCLTEDPCCPPS